MDNYCLLGIKVLCMPASAWAAWTQALLSVAAILFAYAASQKQHLIDSQRAIIASCHDQLNMLLPVQGILQRIVQIAAGQAELLEAWEPDPEKKPVFVSRSNRAEELTFLTDALMQTPVYQLPGEFAAASLAAARASTADIRQAMRHGGGSNPQEYEGMALFLWHTVRPFRDALEHLQIEVLANRRAIESAEQQIKRLAGFKGLFRWM